MNLYKSPISRAVAATFLIPCLSQAEIEIEVYGAANASIESLNNKSTNKKITEVSNNHSVFGVKGAVDAGSGVKGVFLYDAFVGLDNSAGGGGGGSLFGGGRDGYVGLNSGFGTIALGFHGRPWKTSTNHLDLFGSTIADYSAIMGSTRGGAYFDGGIGNALIYFSPDMNGLKVHAQWGADEADNSTNDVGIQANYTTGPIYIAVSHDIDGQGSGAQDISATKGGGSYQWNDTQFVGLLESISDGDANSRSAFYLGASHKLGAITAKVALAAAGDSDASGADDGATYFTIGAEHRYSSNLATYILLSSIKNDDGGRYQYISAPHTSSNGNTTLTSAGKDSGVFALGFKLDFGWKNK